MSKLSAKKLFVVIAGGGTGGHFYPALAIADALVDRGHQPNSIHFVGSKRGIEAKLLPDLSYSHTLLPGRGIKRRFSKDNLGAIAGLLIACVQSLVLLIRKRPKVVLSVGGYAAAPCAIVAVLLRIPLVLAESNAVPGAVHRLVGRFAVASAVALPNTPLPKSIVTGNPVRSEIALLDRSESARSNAKMQLGIPIDRVLIGSFGGSLGSTTINKAISGLAEKFSESEDIAIRQVVGRRDWQSRDWETQDWQTGDVVYSGHGSIVYQAIEYEADMARFLTAVDILVSRSGATTIAEVAAAGVPVIFVPLPNAPGDHQTENAKRMKEAGAADFIDDTSCTTESLLELLSPLVKDGSLRTEMGKAAKVLARPNAAEEVAKIIEKNASQPSENAT